MSALSAVMNVLTFASTMLVAMTVRVCRDTLFWRIPGHVPVCFYMYSICVCWYYLYVKYVCIVCITMYGRYFPYVYKYAYMYV